MKKDLKALMEKNTRKEDYIIKHNLKSDFNLTVNDVAAILGYAPETVQSFVLPYLEQAVAEPDGYIKEYMKDIVGNRRIKKVISRESLLKYIGLRMNIEDEFECIYIPKDNNDKYIEFIDSIQEHVKYTRNIQQALSLACENVDVKWRKEDISTDRDSFVASVFIASQEINTIDEINRFYQFSNLEKINDEYAIKKCNTDEILLMLRKNMYSVREVKDEFKFAHVQQVYRFLERVSCMKIKINDLNGVKNEKSDRNIRYILKNVVSIEELKKCYCIRLNKETFEKLKNTLPLTEFTSLEEYIKYEVLNEVRKIQFKEWKKE